MLPLLGVRADVFAGDHRPGCESDPKANPPQLSPDERERLVKARAEVMALRADDGPWEEYTGPGR